MVLKLTKIKKMSSITDSLRSVSIDSFTPFLISNADFLYSYHIVKCFIYKL